MIKDDQIGWTRHHHHFAYTPLIQQQPHLDPTPYLKHSVQVYSNQKEIASSITATVEPTLPSYTLRASSPEIREILRYNVHALFLVQSVHEVLSSTLYLHNLHDPVVRRPISA